MPAIPKERRWVRFATKRQLAARLVEWAAPILENAGKTVWIVVDGGYTKRPFLQRVLRIPQVVIVGRLRKDAAIRNLPPIVDKRRRSRGRPRKYGKRKISLAKRAGSRVATDDALPAYDFVVCSRVAFVSRTKRSRESVNASPVRLALREILEAFSDRSTIESDFHDVKEVWVAGQQQLRNIWSNVAAYNLNLWMHTLVELWAWNRPRDELCDRSGSPWDDATRRPSHADRRKALRREILCNEFSNVARIWRLPQKIIEFANELIRLSTC